VPSKLPRTPPRRLSRISSDCKVTASICITLASSMVSKVSTDAVPSTSKDVPTVAANAEAVLLSYLATTARRDRALHGAEQAPSNAATEALADFERLQGHGVHINPCSRADGQSPPQATPQRISRSSTLALTSSPSSSSAFPSNVLESAHGSLEAE
jgi:hypothetical protein